MSRRNRTSLVRHPGRRGGGGGGVRSFNEPAGAYDWIITSATVNGSGSPQTLVAGAGWGGLGPLTSPTNIYGLGQLFGYLLVDIAPAVTPGTPGVGSIQIDQVCGSFFMNTFTATGLYIVHVGIFVAELNSTGTTWSMRDPNSATDASRDDWLFLRAMDFSMVSTAGETAPGMLEVPLAIPNPVRIGGGEALMLVIGATNSNAGSFSGDLYARSRVSKPA